MTSANVTEFRIERNGEVVGTHYEHALCHSRWHRLWKFIPFGEHTITAHWLDEEENYHEDPPQNLRDFIFGRNISIGEMKRVVEYAEKQNDLLMQWVDKFGDQDKILSLTTRNAISHSPL